MAFDLMLQTFRLASDSANVIRSIGETSMGLYGQIVKEIKARTNDFEFVDFVHESRLSNVDAHNLARGIVTNKTSRHAWLLLPPRGVCISYK